MQNMPFSTQLTLRELVRSAWIINNENGRYVLFELFSALNRLGCDYFDLASLYAEHDLLENEMDILMFFSPRPYTVLGSSIHNIEKSIFRWTASKYHTNSKEKVVNDIYHRLTLGKPGVTVYNSNENTRSKKLKNDKYILLISKNKMLFLDVNRKVVTQFINE